MRDLGLEQFDAVFDAHFQDLLWHQVTQFEPGLVDRMKFFLLLDLRGDVPDQCHQRLNRVGPGGSVGLVVK